MSSLSPPEVYTLPVLTPGDVSSPPEVYTLPVLTPGDVSSSPPPPGGWGTGTLIGVIFGILIGVITVLVAVGVCVITRRRRRAHQSLENPLEDHYAGPPQRLQYRAPLKDNVVEMLPKPDPSITALDSPSSFGLSKGTFTCEELSVATNGFSSENLLGQGGFGCVHKGILPNGRVVAIKQLKLGSWQGVREFQAEVDIIGSIHHRHLVSLVGYCSSGVERMLVYEFVPNDTLEFHLHGKGRPTMSWETRMKIALGSARGLAYLHEDCQPKVIHRDIKASNILLGYDFEAKVADFGLAKFFPDADTHVSTRIMGNFGYLAPEYASSGKLTDKSDVFSFGVILLELITGRRPVDRAQSFDDDSMVDWARPLLSKALEEGNFDTIADPMLQKNYDPSEMGRMVACAAVSVRHSSRRRPRMSQIVRALEGNIHLDSLNEGLRAGCSTGYNSYGSADFDKAQLTEDPKKFRKMATDSQEQTSSEHSGSNSEYSLTPNQ